MCIYLQHLLLYGCWSFHKSTITQELVHKRKLPEYESRCHWVVKNLQSYTVVHMWPTEQNQNYIISWTSFYDFYVVLRENCKVETTSGGYFGSYRSCYGDSRFIVLHCKQKKQWLPNISAICLIIHLRYSMYQLDRFMTYVECWPNARSVYSLQSAFHLNFMNMPGLNLNDR